MKINKYDFLVIGAGSAGVRASRLAAETGAKVGVVEHDALGGTCVNLGCIPKKLFTYAANFSKEREESLAYGWSGSESIWSWSEFKNNKNREITRLNQLYKKILENAGVEIIHGQASFVDPHTLQVGGIQLKATKILIATGCQPNIPNIPGKEFLVSSNQMFHLEHFPERAIIWGGGSIGMEFASILNGLGCDVKFIYRQELPLRGLDIDLRQFIATQFQQKNIEIYHSQTIQSLSRYGTEITCELDSGTTIKADLVLAALGRKPNVNMMNLEMAGIACDKSGAIVVDDYYQTTCTSVFAIGDVINRVQLTPVAINEAEQVIANLFLKKPAILSYENIPKAVFCEPNIGTVGLTKDQASEKGIEVDVYKRQFTTLKQSLQGNKNNFFLKLIVERSTDRVIGIHLCGPDAAEMIQCLTIAMNAGVTKATFNKTMALHPTISEELVHL